MLKRSLLAALAAAALVVCPARATVTNTTTTVSYTGNGATAAFTVPFKFQQNADLVVTVAGVPQLLGSNYTLSGAGNPTGTVTFGTAPATSAAVVISRVVDYLQATSLKSQRAFDAASVENGLDKVAMQALQNANTHAADKAAQVTRDLGQDASIAALNGTSHSVTDVSSVLSLGSSTPRTLTSRFGGFYNFLDFGAVCNGSSDDTTAINSAATQASSASRFAFGATRLGCKYGASLYGPGLSLLSATTNVPVLGVNISETFTATAGSRTFGAPRLTLGNATLSADDSALLIGRNLIGDSLFSHAIRDESTLNFSTTGAYAAYDANPVMNGSIHYNHLRGFQARQQYNGGGLIDEVAGFSTQLNQTGAGTITNAYGTRVMNPQGAGPITNFYGLWVDTQTRGSSNFGIFVQGNPSFLGGNLQIAGTLTGATTGTFSGEINAQDFNSSGTPASFNANGGVVVAGSTGASAAVIKAYSDAGGTEKTLTLNPVGGLVTTGALLQLGAVTFASLGASPNGTTGYCSNCTVANPCASGGTGAIAKRLNGAWVCN